MRLARLELMSSDLSYVAAAATAAATAASSTAAAAAWGPGGLLEGPP